MGNRVTLACDTKFVPVPYTASLGFKTVTTSAEPRTDAPSASGAGVPEKPALEGLEDKWIERWKADDTYAFVRPATRAEVYSIDTPPPTVSGSLHVGLRSRPRQRRFRMKLSGPQLGSTAVTSQPCAGRTRMSRTASDLRRRGEGTHPRLRRRKGHCRQDAGAAPDT